MPDVFPRSEKEKLRLLARGIDLEKRYRKWMVSMVGERRVEEFLVPSRKDEPENPHKTRLDKIKAAAKETRSSETLFTKSDRAFSKRLGRR